MSENGAKGMAEWRKANRQSNNRNNPKKGGMAHGKIIGNAAKASSLCEEEAKVEIGERRTATEGEDGSILTFI
jgi:hypothetical protein